MADKFENKVTVEAMHYDGTNYDAIAEWIVGDIERYDGPVTGEFSVFAVQELTVEPGDWIIRDDEGHIVEVMSHEEFSAEFTRL